MLLSICISRVVLQSFKNVNKIRISVYFIHAKKSSKNVGHHLWRFPKVRLAFLATYSQLQSKLKSIAHTTPTFYPKVFHFILV